MTTWTEDRAKRVVELWQQGFSAQQVADKLGGVTRSAVISKVHRLGLAGQRSVGRRKSRANQAPRQDEPAVRAAQAEPKRSVERFVFGDNVLPFRKLEPSLPPEPVEEVVVPVNERRAVDKLLDNQCRWPIGDPLKEDFHFCNGHKVHGAPYCERHMRLAYQPVVVKPRRVATTEKAKEAVDA